VALERPAPRATGNRREKEIAMRVVKTVLGSAVLSLLLVAATGGAMEPTCGDQSPRLIDSHALGRSALRPLRPSIS